MMLSDKHLRELAENHELVTPFIRDNCEGATINLTLDSQIKRYKRTGDLVMGQEVKDEDVELINIGETDFYLEPNESILVQAIERFNIPNNMTGMVLEKYSVKLLGLVISPASYMNPGYRGRLSFLMTNHSPGRIQLVAGFRFSQLAINEISSESEKPYTKQDQLYIDSEDVHISKLHLDKDVQDYLKQKGLKGVTSGLAKSISIHLLNRMDENAKQYAEIIRAKLGDANEQIT